MILITDLDDTLYPERSYVESGFRAVAVHFETRFGWEWFESYEFMLTVLECEGRGAVFNRLLEKHGVFTKTLVYESINVYRHHKPTIKLSPTAVKLLNKWDGPLYLVTDGHKIVQQNKIEALDISHYFKKVFITHRYGIRNAKPSIYCFEKIRQIEKCSWQDMAYIGDNPFKDFVNLNPLGVHTIRVLTGQHKSVLAAPGYEASTIIYSLDDFYSLLGQHIGDI